MFKALEIRNQIYDVLEQRLMDFAKVELKQSMLKEGIVQIEVRRDKVNNNDGSFTQSSYIIDDKHIDKLDNWRRLKRCRFDIQQWIITAREQNHKNYIRD